MRVKDIASAARENSGWRMKSVGDGWRSRPWVSTRRLRCMVSIESCDFDAAKCSYLGYAELICFSFVVSRGLVRSITSSEVLNARSLFFNCVFRVFVEAHTHWSVVCSRIYFPRKYPNIRPNQLNHRMHNS